jgi:AraC-like DNA-binding protein
MQRALELLRETKLPVRKIVEMVGYIDVSGFRRKFKSIYGISVADFRNTTVKESE